MGTVGVPVYTGRRREGPGLHLLFLATELLLLAALFALALEVRHHPGPLPGDVPGEHDVQHLLLTHTAVRDVIEAISTLNWPIPVAITLAIVIAIMLFLRHWLDAIIVPVQTGLSAGATLELSRWVHRPRPSDHGIYILQHITGSYSFPSGHVTYAFGTFGLLLFLSTRIRRAVHPVLLWIVRVLLVLLIVLMPVSRILEGEHWPSDTLAGALDGLFWLVLFAHLYVWVSHRSPVLLGRDER